MKTLISKAALAPVAVSFALALSMAASGPASAQAQLTNGPDGGQPNTLAQKPHSARGTRPLTVRRSRAAVPVEAAAAPVAAPVVNPVGGVFGAANAVVGLPFNILGGIFPAPGPRKGGVTAVRYVGAGAKAAEIDEGWVQAVPVDHSGPIYVVANGDPTISPLVLIGEPIRAIGTVAQTPLRILGGAPGL
jgi:hypothetical protein